MYGIILIAVGGAVILAGLTAVIFRVVSKKN